MNINTLILIVLSFNFSSAFAVQVKKCPRAFNVKINDMEKYDKFDVLNYASTFDYADLRSIDYFFNNELSIDRSFYLESTYDSTCRYTSLDNSPWFAKAEIKGTDKSPTLQFKISTPSEKGRSVQFNLQAELAIGSDKKDQYNFANAQTILSVNASNKKWDSDFIYWINLASGTLYLENQFNIENIQIPTSVTECSSFNHRDMVEKIFDNETLFSELNDQAAILLGNWAIDVISSELISEDNCLEREKQFMNLQRLIRKINLLIGSPYDLLDPKAIENENTQISRMIDILNKSGVRFWIINNTKY